MKYVDSPLLAIFIVCSIYAAFMVSPFMGLGLVVMLMIAPLKKK